VSWPAILGKVEPQRAVYLPEPPIVPTAVQLVEEFGCAIRHPPSLPIT
jgi:hypothetical protein